MAALCLATLAAGCGGGGGDAPTAPAPARTTLTIDLGSIEVIEDCDGVEGDGDFMFDVWVWSNGIMNDHVYSQTVNMGPGKTPVLGGQSYSVNAIDGVEINVEFQAVELDRSIIGEVWRDDRLAIAVTRYTHRFSNGGWSNLGPQSLTLGSSGCRVRLHWSARA
jgi:hypothetical protein